MKHVLLLPGGVSLQEEHAFLRLPHPRTGPCSAGGRKNADWQNGQDTRHSICRRTKACSKCSASVLPRVERGSSIRMSYQVSCPRLDGAEWTELTEGTADGSLAMLSPIDPVLLIAGILERLPNHLFREESDIWETAASLDGDDNEQGEWDTFAFGGLDCVKSKLIDVCDAEELDGQPEGRLYRLSTDKYIGRLRQKIDRMIDEADGIFGPYELESLGEQASNAKVFTSVNRALIKEGFGDGRGLGQAVQKGKAGSQSRAVANAEWSAELRIKTSIGILSAYLSPKTAGKLAASYESVTCSLVARTVAHDETRPDSR